MSAAQRHDGYYFTSLVVFRVEDTLFRVPTYRFETMSSKFQELYPLPPGDNKPGASDWNPIVLEDVKADTFLTFLKVLYPECIDSNDSFELGDDKIVSSAITLAQKWGFETVRKLLIEELEPRDLGPVRKLELARIHRIIEWIEPELTNLVERETMLSREETEMIGIDLVTILLRVREKTVQVATQQLDAISRQFSLTWDTRTGWTHGKGEAEEKSLRFCKEVQDYFLSEVHELDFVESDSEVDEQEEEV